MADQLSSPSTTSVVPFADHKAVVKRLEAEIGVLKVDLAAAEAKNPVVSAFIFFVLGLIVGWTF